MPYQSRNADAIARLIQNSGRASSEAQARSGLQRAQLISNIGQMASGTLRDLAQYKLEAPERALRARAMAEQTAQYDDVDRNRRDDTAIRDVERLVPPDPLTGRPNPGAVAKEVQRINPERAREWWNQASADEKAHAEQDHARATKLASTAGAILGLPPEKRPAAWTIARNDLLKDWKPEEVPDTYDETWVTTKFNEAKTIAQQIEALKPPEKKTRVVTVTNPDGSKTEKIVEDVLGAEFKSAPPVDKPPTPGSFEDYLTTWARDTAKRPVSTLSAAQKRRAKADWDSAGRQPDKPEKTDDPELPRGVTDYIDQMRRKVNAQGQPYTFEDAQQDLAQTWPQLRQAHPRVDVVKADSALRSLFRPAPGSGADSFLEAAMVIANGGGARPAAAAPAPRPAPTPRPAPMPAPVAPATAQAFKVTPNANGTVTVLAPDGVTKATFPNQAAADAAIADAQGSTARP